LAKQQDDDGNISKGVASSAVNPGDEGATLVPSVLQHGNQAVASFLIEVQMQQLKILVPVSGKS
jgi:hypothetical protein